MVTACASSQRGDTMGMELWAGAEATVNRVGNAFFDQLDRTGHCERLDDIDRMASLGVRAIRFPLIWERTARDPHHLDWSWADQGLERLRQLGIRPIVGLVHHGSGPPSTNLLDEEFIHGLANFGRRVAERYPWVTDFTPVNEPLTTARFSGLYGHWYPHHRSSESFVRALLIQVRAIAETMRDIRCVSPNARLIQTEDIGSATTTAPLLYQGSFENARRWLSLDLLFGRVNVSHRMYRFLRDAGAPAADLAELCAQPTRPDIIGINYYVTSDRYLDHRLDLYPPHTHGGNGRHAYADVELVRVARGDIVGHEAVLRQVWRRYGAPVSLTEVHLGCTPAEQVRWLAEAWEGAVRAKEAGVDVRSVTLWSTFGAYDWNSLVTRCVGDYEPGVFDLRDGEPRPTALVELARTLSSVGKAEHPHLGGPGWWRRHDRRIYGTAPDRRASLPQAAQSVELS